MTDSELLSETNRLLHRLLEIDAERTAKAKEFEEKHKADMAEWEDKRKESMADRLRSLGLPEEAVEGSEEDWEKRLQEARRKSRDKLDAAKQREEAYRDATLAELRTQSDLLRRIAERLER